MSDATENKPSRPPTRKPPSHETLCGVLNWLANRSPIYAEAMRSAGYKNDGTIVRWMQLSRQGREGYTVRWPMEDGPDVPFFQAINTARDIWIANAEARLRSDCDLGRERVLRDAKGDVIWEKCGALLAEWGGDTPEAKENAERLGGVFDYPYQHRTNAEGKLERVPAVEYLIAPAALRQHIARSIMAGYNPSDRKEIDTRHSGGVMIFKATKQGDTLKGPPPPYSREAMASEAKPLTPLQADLMKRLEDLRARGPIAPTGPVDTGNGSSGEPADKIGTGGPSSGRATKVA
jgi:hypothetical protein